MKINEAYDQWAGQYDTNNNKTRDLDLLVTRKVLESYSFNQVLEIGCGTGKNTIWFSEKATSVLAVDFSEEMLRIARQKVQNKNTTFVEADLLKPWEFTSNLADLVCANLVLEHIEHLPPLFQKVKQRLSPKGIFFVCEYHPFKQYLGSKARFEAAGKTIELTAFTHHTTDFLKAATEAGLQLLELQEWFDESEEEVPRLISFVFGNAGQ